MASKRTVTRRKFLEATGAVSVTTLAGTGCSGGSGDGAGAGGTSSGGTGNGGSAGSVGSGGSGGTGPEDLTIPEGKAAVGIVRRPSVDDAVRRAVELAGGLEEIQSGQTVFIKPNAVHPVNAAPAIVTDLEVLGAVVRLVKERDPGRIIVGDRSARTFDSAAVFDSTGLGQAALDAGADEIYAAPKPEEAPDDWMMVQPDRYDEWWSGVGGVLAMRKMVEADHLINVPTCKNHRWAVFSMCLKAFIGAVGDESRDEMHYRAGMPNDLSRAIAILNQIYSPLMNVIDARGALLNGGPEGLFADAVRTDPGLVLASRDRVAGDVVGVSLLQHELSKTDVPEPDAMHDFLKNDGPWTHPQITHAIERGLGIAGADDLILRFDDVAEADALETIARS